MELRLLKIFILAFLICSVSAKRWGGGGGSSRGSSRGSVSRPRPVYTPSHSSPSHSRPSSTSSNSGRISSSNFLHAESGRPSLPANTHHQSSWPKPSAPVHQTSPSHGSRPGGVVHESHQQSSVGGLHNDPYGRQPASNPFMTHGQNNNNNNHGSHASPPYPVGQPNHPHPSNGGGYHPPTNGGGYHPPTNGGGYHPPTNGGGYHPPTNGGGYHPPTNAGVYHPPTNAGVYHPPTNAGVYHPPTSGGVYHPPTSGGVYHPPMNGAVYHPPTSGGVYHPPTSGGAYHPPISGPVYHPSVNQAPVYHPSTGYHPPQPQTVYVLPDSRSRGSSSGPGIGTYIASGVAGGVAAGATNAIVDHAISSIFRPNSHGVHTYPSAPAPVQNTPTTSITNNYYYPNGQPNNGAPSNNPGDQTNFNNGQPAQNNFNNGQPGQSNFNNGQPAQNNFDNGQPGQNNFNNGQSAQVDSSQNPANNQGMVNGAPISGGQVSRPSNSAVNRSPDQLAKPDDSVNFISDDDIMKLTEDLFDNLSTNINQYVELNLQKRVSVLPENAGPIPDEAPEPLFIIKTGIDSIPTVSKLKALYDQYQRNGTQKEIVTSERMGKEDAFLDEAMRTPVMKKALNWLVEKHYVKPNQYEQRQLLKNMWFTVFRDTSSGFERAFLHENYGDAGIAGMQNWIYFAHLEGKNLADYMGYVDMLSLSGRGALVRLNVRSENVTMQSVPIFVGTPPELELALYTVCMHVRYGGYCPISLGGAKFLLYTQGSKDNDKYIIESGFPIFS